MSTPTRSTTTSVPVITRDAQGRFIWVSVPARRREGRRQTSTHNTDKHAELAVIVPMYAATASPSVPYTASTWVAKGRTAMVRTHPRFTPDERRVVGADVLDESVLDKPQAGDHGEAEKEGPELGRVLRQHRGEVHVPRRPAQHLHE